MLSAGSRGDAEPYCAISQRLLKRSVRSKLQIDLFLQSDWVHLADPFRDIPSFRLHAFPFSGEDFYRVSTASRSSPQMPHPNSRMKHVATVAAIVGELVLPCLPQVLQVVDDANMEGERVVIVSSAFTRSIALLVAHAKRNVRVVLVHLQPLLPNRIIPSYRTSRDEFVHACLAGSERKSEENNYSEGWCEDSYWKVEHALEEVFLKDRSKRWYEQCFGYVSTFPNWNDMQQMLVGRRERVWIANAYSNHLIPPLIGTPGVGPCVIDVGPLADGYVSSRDAALDPTLQHFLSSSPAPDEGRPLCIGFGSMPFRNIGVILEAIKQLKVRAVLVGKVFLQIPESHPAIRHKRILCVASAPYPLLLPQCSMMICHGGIGVVQACLRAGVPCLASPLMGDQFSLAELLEAKGYGVRCGTRLSELTVQNIVHSVKTAVGCQAVCQDLARKISEEDPSGPDTLADLILSLGVQEDYSK